MGLLGYAGTGKRKGLRGVRLSDRGIQDKAAWEQAGVKLPAFDWKEMCAETEKAPAWVHFGAGNIFRGFSRSCWKRGW